MKNGDRFAWLELENERVLIFDRSIGRFILSDKRGDVNAFLMTAESFTTITDEINKLFGTATPIILQKAGYGAGRSAAKHLVLSDDISTAVKTIFNSVSRWGFGSYELLEFDPENKFIRFRLHNCVFAVPRNSPNFLNSMQYLIGFYKGYFSIMFGIEVDCKETKCLSLGDEYCEFEVKKPVISGSAEWMLE